ncbi:conserved hypothetical protein (plasmid) [Sinorhizobium fredii NGR234]|uniref:Transmembrane protein n=1 Tax=Sinorhizobium fredii (strain NBRC 101917 / NGR234) TaxID=394 RepID=C3KQD7_SINFN|nr:hypothetical protein [Sinorhizobium fredii]ACP22295.1 conserved hypothetical protein [Sinorhizobium fredii NGR234]
MTMAPLLRKIALIAHIISSVGSLGAVAAFLALAIAGLSSEDGQVIRSVYVTMEVIARTVIIPLVFASLATGLIQSLGTTWGLFRHYWVLTKLLLTIFTATVLMLQMDGIAYVAARAAETAFSSGDLLGLRRSLVVHAAGGLVVLLVTTTLSVLKPRGLTRYGWRKLQRQ